MLMRLQECLLTYLLTYMMMMMMMRVQVSAVGGRMECRAGVIVTVGVVLGLILVVVWESVFTPAVHLADDSNNTVSSLKQHSLRT